VEAAFREGFVPATGVKPKASDYAPIPRALIIHACADYSARILAKNGFPDVQVQARWAAETFKGACRSAPGGKLYILTARMAKIVRLNIHLPFPF
jgi:hypothetical protein